MFVKNRGRKSGKRAKKERKGAAKRKKREQVRRKKREISKIKRYPAISTKTTSAMCSEPAGRLTNRGKRGLLTTTQKKDWLREGKTHPTREGNM